MAAIEENKNTSIYVIDEEYHLVYFNEVLQQKYPQARTGELCYQRLCGEKQPCQICPLNRKNNTETLYYNRLMKCWINIGTGTLSWTGKGRCHIILASSIHEEDALYEELLNPLTGLYKRNAFFQKGEEFLGGAPEGRYCLAAIDIEHFKLFNDWYGQQAGDKLLVDIGGCLLRLQQEGRGVAGYMGGDDFAVVMPNDGEEVKKLQVCITEYVKAYGENAGFLPTFGIYEIEAREFSLSAMYDRAVIAANSIKGNYAQRICYYDRRMKQRMEEDHLLLSEVQRGLVNGEFLFYTQPQCDLSTGRIVGLEALVRWNHSVRGVISPGVFLPLLESNGLITNLDIFIWESVCRKVRGWIDQGWRPIPISVNVSCVDIFAIDVVDTFRQMTERYGLDPRLIEIEITESAYVERFDEVIHVVEALRSAGFTVLMDDFGSGYSSLNMLKDVKVDILKIDMKFLDLNENSLGRGVSILEAIARMAHIMGLKLIAEGVETRKQVEFLLNVGCSYGQGYYFYRPMEPEDMEKLIVNEEIVDFRGITLQQMNPVRMRDLFNEDVLSDTMAGNILGAAAFYDVHDNTLELLRANERYCAVTRTSMVDLEVQRREIIQEVYPEDRGILWGLFQQARENQTKGAEGEVRHRTGDGDYLWLRMRIFYLREQNGHRIYYGSLSNVTEDNRRELMLTGRKMESILRQAGINSWDWDFEKNTLRISGSAALFPALSYRWFKGERGQTVLENFTEVIARDEYIPERNRETMWNYLERVKVNPPGKSIRCEFPMELENGKNVWLMAACETLWDENGRPVKAVGYYRNISEERRQVQHLTQMAETDAMTGLFNRQAAISRIEEYIQNIGDNSAAMVMFDLDNFKQANDVFGHSFGDTMIVENARKLKRFFRRDDIICRIGGDEFLILCKNIREKDLLRKLGKVINAMMIVHEREGQSIHFSSSAGYVMIPEQGTEFDDLYGKTDVALFAAKLKGKGGFCKYSPKMKSVRYELAEERVSEEERADRTTERD